VRERYVTGAFAVIGRERPVPTDDAPAGSPAATAGHSKRHGTAGEIGDAAAGRGIVRRCWPPAMAAVYSLATVPCFVV